MSVWLLIFRLALAAVFAVAALGKLSDLGASRLAVERFGVPARIARPLGLLLPLTELAIAAGLLVLGAAHWAALGAVVLLLVFCLAIVRVLARGEAPDCNCFGSLGSAPVGRGTLVRNGALIAVAGFVLIAGWNDGGASAFAWIGDHRTLADVAGVIAAVSAVHMAFSWQLFRQNGRLLDRLIDLEAAAGSRDHLSNEGLAIGEPAPDFVLPDLDGRSVALEDLLAAGRGALLFFTNPGCGQCDPLLPALGRAQAVEGGLPVAVISAGDAGDNRAKTAEHGIAQVLLQEAFEVANAYRVFGVPAAVLIDETGRIASERASGAQSVTELLEAMSGSPLRLVEALVDGAGEFAAVSAR